MRIDVNESIKCVEVMILKSQLNVSESCDLSERIITRDLTKCQTPRHQKCQKPLINTPQDVDNHAQTSYNTSITSQEHDYVSCVSVCTEAKGKNHSGSVSIE